MGEVAEISASMDNSCGVAAVRAIVARKARKRKNIVRVGGVSWSA